MSAARWIRLGALIGSVALHAGLWWSLAARPVAGGGAPEVAPPFSRVTLQFAAAPAEPVAEETPPEEERPPVVEEPPPEPKPEPEPKPVEKPKPKPEKPRETKRPKREPAPEKPATPSVASQQTAPTVAVQPAPPSPLVSAQAKADYLATLLAHIEQHKQYPTTARRRRIEGLVQVHFELLEGGRIKALVTAEGHRLLQAAAEEAVRAALPLPPPPEGMKLPYRVDFGIVFKLR